MFNDMTLYYLNQIGIVPWISRESLADPLPQSSKPNSHQLIVLVSNSLQGKTQCLFNQMLNYLNIPSHEVLIVKIEGQEFNGKNNNPWFSRFSDKDPLVLLSLGPQLNNLNSPYPLFQGLSLESVLDNPLSKKELFATLNQIKVRLAGLLS